MGTVQIIKDSILPRQTKRRIYYTKKFLITSALLHNGNTLAAKILVTIITFVQNDIGSEFLLALIRNAVFFMMDKINQHKILYLLITSKDLSNLQETNGQVKRQCL